MTSAPGKDLAKTTPVTGDAPRRVTDSSPGLPVVPVKGPAQVISLVPWLLGFQPGNADLVVIGTAPPRDRVTLTWRWDLPDPATPVLAIQARHAVAALAVQGCTKAVAVGFGPDRLVAPAVTLVRDAATAAGLEIGDLLRADGGRYWSYLCTSPQCCPPEGIPYNPDASPVTAAYQAAGAPPPQASRDAVAATIAPATGAQAALMLQAVERAVLRARRLDQQGSRPGRKARQPPLAISGTRAVTAAIKAYQDGGTITSYDQLAWLAVTLAVPQVRDAAWLRMDPAHRHAHQRLWTTLTHLAPPGHVTAPAALLAFTAWQDGNGVLANLALDRAQADSPADNAARVLRTALESGAPPSLADPAAMIGQARTLKGNADGRPRTPHNPRPAPGMNP
jgi:hypothetical protein